MIQTIERSDTMRGQKTREKIMEAAIKVISNETIEGLSTRKVSSEAKVNLAAIHYHHRSKEGMLIDLSRYIITKYVFPTFEELYSKAENPKNFVVNLFNKAFQLFEERPDVVRTLVYPWLHGTKNRRIKDILVTGKQEFMEKCVDVLEENMSTKRAKKVISRTLNMLIGLIMDALITNEKPSQKELNELAGRLA